MTSAQVPSRIAMPCPFGGFGTENITPIQNLSGSDVNFPDGFPAIYGAPVDNNGRFVTRKEMNAIGNLASRDLFYHKCGGLNTFDADFCAQISGYPYGAVLDYLSGNQLYSVMSLKDNNKVDFTGATPTPSQSTAGITSGSVDGINWVFCNKEMPSQQIINIMSGNESTANIGSFKEGYICGVFTAPANGVVTGAIHLEYGYEDFTSEVVNCVSLSFVSGVDLFIGGGLFIKDVTGELSGINLEPDGISSWTCVANANQTGRLLSDTRLVYLTPNCYSSHTQSPSPVLTRPTYGSIFVSAGRKYAVATVASQLLEVVGTNFYSVRSDYFASSIRYNGFNVKLSVV